VNRLWVKLSLAFLAISLAAIGVVAVLSARATREQFRQVVLLPQGEFATFLRAGDDERREVLGKLCQFLQVKPGDLLVDEEVADLFGLPEAKDGGKP